MHLIRRKNDFKNLLSANMVTANKMPQKTKKPVNSSSASVKQKQFWIEIGLDGAPGGLGCCPFWGGGSVVVDFLFIVTPIVGVCNCYMFCCTLLYVHSSIAIILMGKRELIALLNLSSWCLVMVERLFLAVPRGCLQFVIVVFPDHTYLLF